MKRNKIIIVSIITMLLVVFFAMKLSHLPVTNKVQVTNTGKDVVEIKTKSNESKLLLGQNGTGYFGSNSKIQIGDALIKVGKSIEVVNIGSGIIPLVYHTADGYEQKMLIGQGAVGYVSKSTPFKIGYAEIRIND